MNRTHKSPITIYTHNHFKTFERCKRKYYYEYIKKLHWPSLESNFELGLSIHKLLDYQAKGLEVESLVKDSKEEIKTYWQYINNDTILGFPVIESEWGFSVCIEKNQSWLEGRIDRLIKDNINEKYIILDFKTGQNIPKPLSTDWQLATYLLCVADARNIPPEQLAFWYYRVDEKPVLLKKEYSQQLHASYRSEIENMINKIKINNHWNTDPDCNNKYCQYEKLCREELL